MTPAQKQLEVAAHWLNEAATAVSGDTYLRLNLERVRDACLRVAGKRADEKEPKEWR